METLQQDQGSIWSGHGLRQAPAIFSLKPETAICFGKPVEAVNLDAKESVHLLLFLRVAYCNEHMYQVAL